MVKYQLLQGYSPLAPLTVTSYPAVQNLTIIGPSSPQLAGAALSCGFTFSNVGGGDGTIIFTLKNQAGATLGTVNISVAAGQGVTSGAIPFTMPSADITLTLTSNYGGSVSATIEVTLQIGTTLTLGLSPSTAKVGGTVTASGYLSRNDNPQNYVGVNGVTVQLLKSDNTLVASGTTTSTGGYSISFTAPSTAGSYSYKTYFAGSGLLASAFSTPRSIGVGIYDAVRSWFGAIPILVGAILVKTSHV